MLKPLILSSTLALSTLLSGCVGSGPRTEQGAVVGGALGALAGAVIGHNSGRGDALGGAILGSVAGAVAGGAIGNSRDQEEGTLYGSQPQPRYRTVAQPPPEPPPPLNSEVVPPPPTPNSLWIPGYWSYDGRGYSWIAGRWEIPPPTARSYVAAHWENQGGTYVFVQPYWR